MTKPFEILAFIILVCGTPAFALHGGESSGGGGNAAAAEFTRLASLALETLAGQGPLKIGDRALDLAAMEKSLADLKIQPTLEELRLDEKSVDAINYPDQDLLVLNSDHWEKLNATSKLQLVFHELWGLSFHDHQDDNYQNSTALFRLLTQSGFENPGDVVSLVSDNENGRGQTHRALLVTRDAGSENRSVVFIVEKLQQIDDLEVVMSYITYTPEEVGADEFSNLRLTPSFRAFKFEAEQTGGQKILCSYSIPEAIERGPLEKIPLKCSPIRQKTQTN